MKAQLSVLFLLVLMLLSSCNAQKIASSLPKIEDYSKGELAIKVTPFGLDNPVQVGKISADGTIHFNWNDDLPAMEDPGFWMSSIKNSIGMTFCNDKEIEHNDEDALSILSKNLFLYKEDRQVGILHAGTQKGTEDNAGSNRSTTLVLGSTISWIYADRDALFKAKCSIDFELENVYRFREVTDYAIELKKGWNMVLNTLEEKEDWTHEADKGSLPKTITKTSISDIPTTMKWYLNYWAD